MDDPDLYTAIIYIVENTSFPSTQSTQNDEENRRPKL